MIRGPTVARQSVALHQLLDDALLQARSSGESVLVSHAESIPALAPIDFFERGRSIDDDRHYWERPDVGFALVGIGAAWSVESDGPRRFATSSRAWSRLRANTVSGGDIDNQTGAGPVLLGGFSFDPLRPPTAAWTGFPSGRLVLPRFTLTIRGNLTFLTSNVVVDSAMDLDTEAERLLRDRGRLLASEADVVASDVAADLVSPTTNGNTQASPSIVADDVRPATSWQGLVAATSDAIRHGLAEKVVLARAVRARGVFRPESALRRLRDSYSGCIVFAVARGSACFLGATPERLVRVDNGEVRVSCLAGTIGRGSNDDDDRILGDELLASAKDRGEHAVVVRTLTGQLAGRCTDLSIPAEPVLMKLPNVQHLYTPIIGRIAPGGDLLSLVEHLHPTPAVGGFPREAALSFIREREELDRGWYAGPIGWIDRRGEGEFAVAIRSALIRSDDVSGDEAGQSDRPSDEALLYVGCGIVADSDPASEYQESRLKLRPMLSALGGP